MASSSPSPPPQQQQHQLLSTGPGTTTLTSSVVVVVRHSSSPINELLPDDAVVVPLSLPPLNSAESLFEPPPTPSSPSSNSSQKDQANVVTTANSNSCTIAVTTAAGWPAAATTTTTTTKTTATADNNSDAQLTPLIGADGLIACRREHVDCGVQAGDDTLVLLNSKVVALVAPEQFDVDDDDDGDGNEQEEEEPAPPPPPPQLSRSQAAQQQHQPTNIRSGDAPETAAGKQQWPKSETTPANNNNKSGHQHRRCRNAAAAARSFFARIRNRLKKTFKVPNCTDFWLSPIAPCQALHLVPSSSGSLAADGNNNNKNNMNMDQEEDQKQHRRHHHRGSKQQQKKQQQSSPLHQQAEVIVEPMVRDNVARKCDEVVTSSAVVEVTQEPPQQQIVTIESSVVRSCARSGQHLVPVQVTSTTTVEIATTQPLVYQQHSPPQRAPYISTAATTTYSYPPNYCNNNSSSNNNLPSAVTGSSSGFFSSSSFSKTAQSPPSFSPTADDFIQQSHQYHSPRSRIPVSQSCPFPAAVAAPKKKKKEPPLVKFNQLGDISPTVKKQQRNVVPPPATADSGFVEPTVVDGSRGSSGNQPRRLFSRSFNRGSANKRPGFFSRKQQPVSASKTMPSLRESSLSRGYESDGPEERPRTPRRANSLSSILAAFLRGRSRRSASPRPRVASPVGPRLSPDTRQTHAGYHCDVPSCHCHEFPYAYGSLRSTVMHRPHLQPSSQQRPSSYHTPSNAADQKNNGKAESPQNEAAFLRGYGPNAPDDPAPQFHRRIVPVGVSLALDSDDFYDDDDDLLLGSRQPGCSFTNGPQMTSTPYTKSSSPLFDKKTIDSRPDGMSSTFLRTKPPKGVSFAGKPPPIVSFVQNESEDDLLYRDGDLIQTCNGNHAVKALPPDSLDITEQLVSVQIDGVTKEVNRRTLLFPRSPESPPVQRMPVVFLPAYPRCAPRNTPSNSLTSSTSSRRSVSYGTSTANNPPHNHHQSGATSTALPAMFCQQKMTPLRT